MESGNNEQPASTLAERFGYIRRVPSTWTPPEGDGRCDDAPQTSPPTVSSDAAAAIRSPTDAAPTDTERLDWLDLHCAFVADEEYRIGPFKVGELRKLADAGIAEDRRRDGRREGK